MVTFTEYTQIYPHNPFFKYDLERFKKKEKKRLKLIEKY
jgi:hypothetical protein